MMIRQGIDELPPKMFLMQILDDLTKIYIFLWEKKDRQNRISLMWREISKHYNKNTFKSNFRKLCNQGLLSYEESDDGIAIELVGWDDLDDYE